MWDRPQPHARTIEVAGVVLHGVYDLVATLEQLLHADLRALLGDADPIPAGSTVLGDPAAIASHDAVVEPGVVFDRSEERRVGKEGRSRRGTDEGKKARQKRV